MVKRKHFKYKTGDVFVGEVNVGWGKWAHKEYRVAYIVRVYKKGKSRSAKWWYEYVGLQVDGNGKVKEPTLERIAVEDVDSGGKGRFKWYKTEVFFKDKKVNRLTFLTLTGADPEELVLRTIRSGKVKIAGSMIDLKKKIEILERLVESQTI